MKQISLFRLCRVAGLFMICGFGAVGAQAQPAQGAGEKQGDKATVLPGTVKSAAGAGAPAGAISHLPFLTPPTAPLPLLSVSFDDDKTYLFIVDPGTQDALIDREFARAKHFPTRMVKTESNTQVEIVLLEKVVFKAPAPWLLTGLPFVPDDLSEVRQRIGLGPEVVGILGANILRAFVERVDFHAKTITFFRPGYAVTADKLVHRVPLQTTNFTYALNASVDGIAARFPLSFLDNLTRLQDPALLTELKPVAKVQELTPPDQAGEELMRLQSLSAEGAFWKSPVVTHSLNPASKENSLGLDFYQRFAVTLDLGAKQMYLETDLTTLPTKEFLGTGFKAMRDAEGNIVVGGIMVPSSAAEAGVKIGDRILEINGLPLATTPIPTVLKAMRPIDGADMKIKVQRKGEEKPREFTLKNKKLI